MYFIEILLGISFFMLVSSIIPIVLINKNKLDNLFVTIAVISIILIVLCLFLYICNSLMTCISIWFGNW